MSTILVKAGFPYEGRYKECFAVLIELYKKNVTVSCVGSDLLSEMALSTANSQPVVMKLANDIHHRTLSGGDYTGIPS